MPSLAASVACGSGRPAFCACGQTALNVVDGVGFCKDHRAEAVAAQTAKSNLESARVQAGYAAHSRRRISFHLRSVSIQAGV